MAPSVVYMWVTGSNPSSNIMPANHWLVTDKPQVDLKSAVEIKMQWSTYDAVQSLGVIVNTKQQKAIEAGRLLALWHPGNVAYESLR